MHKAPRGHELIAPPAPRRGSSTAERRQAFQQAARKCIVLRFILQVDSSKNGRRKFRMTNMLARTGGEGGTERGLYSMEGRTPPAILSVRGGMQRAS